MPPIAVHGKPPLHRGQLVASSSAVPRPVDVLLEYLEAEQARGVTHVHVDEEVRSLLRSLQSRSRSAPAMPAAAAAVSGGAALPPVTEPEPARETVRIAAPVVVGGSREERLASLRRQAEAWPPVVALGTLHETMVFSVGDPEARLMLVGEAPGYHEEKQREPFAGPSGQKLDQILQAMGLAREQVYLSNIVKFRPSAPRQTINTRKPTAEEIAVCLPILQQEIEIVRPQCIVALGSAAVEGLLGVVGGAIDPLREKWHDFQGIPLRVTYHPGYLLQNATADTRRRLWEDMLAVMERIGLPISEKQRGFFSKG
jgi:uracil-DNA glycosylase